MVVAKFEDVTLRLFEESDVPIKVKWINSPENNQYLHYDLPMQIDRTVDWFRNKDNSKRLDCIIEYQGVLVGLIGLLSIDDKNKKAEFYIVIGEAQYKGKGIAKKASEILLNYAFNTLSLNRIYLYTESENIAAQCSFEQIGFKREGLIRSDLASRGTFVDRYLYGITKEKWQLSSMGCSIPITAKSPPYRISATPINYLFSYYNNQYYIKRDDLIPFSFGGNKARKAVLFFEQIDRDQYDCVVTYGRSSSNHCRVVANMAAQRRIDCSIISPEEVSNTTFNSQMMKAFGASITMCPVDDVYNTIESKLQELRIAGRKPFFIPGGGHGVIGTQAYVECYHEIQEQERQLGIHFDYIFHASGTGTTQAGLVCGQLIAGDERVIVGISIARNNPRGGQVVIDSVKEYLKKIGKTESAFVSDMAIKNAVQFIDSYTNEGYGHTNKVIDNIIAEVLLQYGVPLDSTYTGKAFWGMREYMEGCAIGGKNILFIHTGGTPLFFDDLRGKDAN